MRSRLGSEDPHPKHGALFRGVVTDEHDAFGLFEVFVRARRAVGAERLHQGRGGGGGAQSRVCVDVRHPEPGTRDFPERVVLLEQQLPAVVDGDGVRTVGGQGVTEPLDDEVHRFIPRGTDVLALTVADERKRGSAGVPVGEILVHALGPETAVAHRMAVAAADADDLFSGNAYLNPAPNGTDATRRRHPAVGGNALVDLREPARRVG